MSLYNMLFGVNPLSGIVLESLGLTPTDVPRFRDAYYDAELNRLVIYTRTGGGNREYYDSKYSRLESLSGYAGEDPSDEDLAGPYNDDLRDIVGFMYDEDDDFDCTYAYFYFAVPVAFEPIFDTMRDLGAGKDLNPTERFQKMIVDLQKGNVNEDTDRALKVGQVIFDQISGAIDNGNV